MANSIDAYRDQLLALLPQGQAWPKHADSELAKLLQGIAHELHRTEKRAEDILDEAHPSKAFEVFEEWETMHGLPHACGGSQNFQERRSALIQAYQSRGGQSREFFIALAALLGFPITITEYRERLHGDSFSEVFGNEDSNYIWQVNAPTLNYQERHFGQPHGDVYRSWSNQRLECVLQRLVHAHRLMTFSYH